MTIWSNGAAVRLRKARGHGRNNGYARNSYIIKADTPRFGSGEAKAKITESIRGDDLYLLVDVAGSTVSPTKSAASAILCPRTIVFRI